MINTIINFPKDHQKEVKQQRKERLLKDKHYRIKANINEVKHSFVFNLKGTNILGSHTTLEKGDTGQHSFDLSRNLELHDISRIFIKGSVEIDSQFEQFVASIKNHDYRSHHDFTQVTLNLGVVLCRVRNINSRIHEGWYSLNEEEPDRACIRASVRYEYKSFNDLLNDFKTPFDCTLILTLADKSDLIPFRLKGADKRAFDLEGYPWKESGLTFFYSKHYFYLEM